MPGMPDAHRLAQLMEERRLDLGLRWNDVAAESGMSVEGLRAMRRDGAVPRPLNQRGIEKALRWERGSIDRILQGEDPVPVAAAPDAELDALERSLDLDLSALDPELRRALLRHYQRIDERMSELERQAERRRGA